MNRSGSTLTESMIETASLLAESARQSTLEWFRKPVEVVSKQDLSPVTQADRQTEQTLRNIISARHPGHAIIGEEFGNQEGSEPWTWIIDPIDGTKCFATGEPTYGSLIALVYEFRPVLGIIEMPALEERWIGIAGLPTVCNGRPCKTSTTQALSDASVQATTPDMFDENTWPKFCAVTRKTRFRNFGTDCYGYALVASGFADMVMEADLKTYDYMAIVPIVEGAGGVVSDWQGQPVNLESGHEILASANQSLHQQALDIIQS